MERGDGSSLFKPIPDFANSPPLETAEQYANDSWHEIPRNHYFFLGEESFRKVLQKVGDRIDKRTRHNQKRNVVAIVWYLSQKPSFLKREHKEQHNDRVNRDKANWQRCFHLFGQSSRTDTAPFGDGSGELLDGFILCDSPSKSFRHPLQSQQQQPRPVYSLAVNP